MDKKNSRHLSITFIKHSYFLLKYFILFPVQAPAPTSQAQAPIVDDVTQILYIVVPVAVATVIIVIVIVAACVYVYSKRPVMPISPTYGGKKHFIKL